MYDDYGIGQFRVIANNSEGNYYVWDDWDSWESGIPYNVAINRSMPGDYMYILQYYDDLGQYGQPDWVIVTILNDLPTSNHPSPVITSASGTETIAWILNDDFGSGQYRVIVNDSVDNSYTWIDWTDWQNNTNLNVPINRSAPGDYEYTIEYYDNVADYGLSDIVDVTITNSNPTSNHPADDTIDKDTSKTITWIISDDFGSGKYRVLVNGTAGSWNDWISGVQIDYNVDTSVAGLFNFTIEYHDDYGLFGVSDTVMITIEEAEDDPQPNGGDGEPTVPGYDLLFVSITMISISAYLIRKRLNKQS
jgi:hypothetical protein